MIRGCCFLKWYRYKRKWLKENGSKCVFKSVNPRACLLWDLTQTKATIFDWIALKSYLTNHFSILIGKRSSSKKIVYSSIIMENLILLSCLCLFVPWSLQCGTGPSVSRGKVMKPMVLYQRLPDVDEESIRGSGMFRRIITRGSKEFSDLVKNYNKDIVFDGVQANRLMTKVSSSIMSYILMSMWSYLSERKLYQNARC